MRDVAADAFYLPIAGTPFKVEAIVFDLDGTLYPRKVVKRAMIRALFPGLLKLKRYTQSRECVTGSDFGNAQTMQEAILNRACGENSRRTRKLRHWVKTRYYPALLRCIAWISARDGFPELMCELHDRGVKLAVVSDYGSVRERLLSLGFNPELFTLLLGTEEFGMMKPAQRINTLIFESLRTAPAATVMVGDRAHTDCALAQAAGMLFLGIYDEDYPPDTDNVWFSWPEFKALFKEML